MKALIAGMVIAVTFGLAACETTTDAPGSDPHPGEDSATAQQAATTTSSSGGSAPPVYVPPAYCANLKNFFTVSDGSMTNSSGLVLHPEKSGENGSVWTLPITPPGTSTSIFVKWSFAYGGLCPPLVSAADMAAYGHVTIDGSPVGVDYLHVYGAAQNDLSSTIHLPMTPGSHTVTLSYVSPRARYLTAPITSSFVVSIVPVNPFYYLQFSYASARCQECHAFGARSITYQQVGHPFDVQGGPVGCGQECHQPFYDKYAPAEERHEWNIPAYGKDMDWSVKTVRQQCQATMLNLPSAAALHDHFDTDPRLKWAVESGELHYGISRPTAWPHDVPMFQLLADWWIDSGLACDVLDPASVTRFQPTVY